VNLTLRNVEVEGRDGLDVRIEGGRIVEIGARLARGDDIDGRGGALIPGLADHHIHLFALAAREASVVLDDVRDAATLVERVRAGSWLRPGSWVRATGYHERMAGELSRQELDALAPHFPLRIQHQTGALWMLNSQALALVAADDGPPCVERGADGGPTGRIWRGDAWLRERLGAEPPPLRPIGAQLARFGVTHLTDASVTTDAAAAARLADARRVMDLQQHLMLMSGEPLEAPDDGAFAVGPVKVLLDDHALPDLDDFIARIGQARLWGRAVAVHCVTAGELALTLAAFGAAGARTGDRIEHGGVIPTEAISQLRALGLIVVTQSAFVRERGDRYLAEVDPAEQPDLYRHASLKAEGVQLAGSSDAPYATPDPWVGIAAAMDRFTLAGRSLGPFEGLRPHEALGLYLGDLKDPAGPPRRVAEGAAADLCLLRTPLAQALRRPTSDLVRATFIGGPVYLGPS